MEKGYVLGVATEDIKKGHACKVQVYGPCEMIVEGKK
jgi:hypothetical protein